VNQSDEEIRIIEGELLNRGTTTNLKHNPLQAIVKAPGPDLKKIKYKPLPSIQSNDSKPLSAERNLDSDLAVYEVHPPTSVTYFVGIRAQSHELNEFKTLFSHSKTFYLFKKSDFNTSKANVNIKEYQHMRGLFSDMMESLLNDVFQEPSIQKMADEIMNEPIPYYRPREESEKATDNAQEILL
jgi:hypothetical protein